MEMKPENNQTVSITQADSTEIDFSDLLGVNQAFTAVPDAAAQAALIDAHCNKIGTECQ